ncbi:MAG: hypothetical protein ACE5EF_04550 [Dehalococcoidia bacterium]
MLTVNPDGTAISRISLRLLPETAARLRKQFPVGEDERWVLEEAEKKGWEEANRSFLRWHRERGRAEMTALLEALAIKTPPSLRTATELVALGYETFMLPEGFQGDIDRLTEDSIRISVSVCPVYHKFEQDHWQGVTACGSWHHRQGWYDAMGLTVADDVLSEEKWGDVACVCEVRFADPRGQPPPPDEAKNVI